MGIKDVTAYFKSRQVADTPATSATSNKIITLQEKPLQIKAVTSATSATSKNTDSRNSFLKSQPVQAANDPASVAQTPAPAPAPAETPATGVSLGSKPGKPAKRLNFLDWADGWIELDRAYQRHHFACPVCISAGKGYGQRCGVGAALYRSYEDAAGDKSAMK